MLAIHFHGTADNPKLILKENDMASSDRYSMVVDRRELNKLIDALEDLTALPHGTLADMDAVRKRGMEAAEIGNKMVGKS